MSGAALIFASTCLPRVLLVHRGRTLAVLLNHLTKKYVGNLRWVSPAAPASTRGTHAGRAPVSVRGRKQEARGGI